MSNNNITVTESAGELLIQFPYALRDSFLSIFKTAQWNTARRGYIVKASTMNKNKSEKFQHMAAGAVAALDAADETDMLERDVEALRAKFAEIQAETAAKASRADALREEAARIRELLMGEQAKAEAAAVELEKARVEAEAALEPVRRLCAEQGVPAALTTLRSYSRRSFMLAEQKRDFSNACRTLSAANAKLAEMLSVRLPALDALADANYNRLDNLRDALTRYSNIYANAVAVEAEVQ